MLVKILVEGPVSFSCQSSDKNPDTDVDSLSVKQGGPIEVD